MNLAGIFGPTSRKSVSQPVSSQEFCYKGIFCDKGAKTGLIFNLKVYY